ncbi:hypothetical protein [uncultured Akkermansia sp.]|uniref:hypothetical protein n=1 Tax=uncultured Akkermansia sp. TaxID=512294 RepID=UPI002634BFAE|nr:hypothetical protein [uncultured Akkermansia sp.]
MAGSHQATLKVFFLISSKKTPPSRQHLQREDFLKHAATIQKQNLCKTGYKTLNPDRESLLPEKLNKNGTNEFICHSSILAGSMKRKNLAPLYNLALYDNKAEMTDTKPLASGFLLLNQEKH